MSNSEHDIADLRIRSEPSELAQVRACVHEKAELIGFDENAIGEIMLAVDEALANVIRHGYGGACDRPIEIRIERTQDGDRPGLVFTIRDFGRQVDPQAIVSRPLDDVRPGGLGVHIIQSVMDEVTYDPAEGGGMRLTMKKTVT